MYTNYLLDTKMVQSLQLAKPVEITSVSGVLTLTADSNSFIAGGNEAITTISGGADIDQGIYVITWNTARTLTYDAVKLQLIGKADRITAIGDVGFYQINGAVVTELAYTPISGYADKAYSTVLVDGTKVNAESPAATLELIAGTNIALTPDAVNKSVTIAVTGKVASAAHADTADEATNAAHADAATNADHAALADNATNAAHADTATTAANCTGNAATASKLETARTIYLNGDATGSAAFDGSADATIEVDVLNANNAANAVHADNATHADEAAVADSVAWDNVTGKPATFPPPVATADVLGGIKQGNGLVIEADGTANVTGFLPLAGGSMSGAINEAMGASIASDAITDIGAASGNFVQVTGTTTITSLGVAQAGTRRIVQFAGALTLTHNADSLILPGAKDIITVAGDVAEFVSLGSGNWLCSNYTKASGQPVVVSTFGGQQLFTASGTFTVPEGATSTTPFYVTVIGGGGGGAGGQLISLFSDNGVPNYTVAGGGGGGGGAAQFAVPVSGLAEGQAINVTIGNGGNGGAGGTTGSYGSNGGAGGASSFGTYVTANGGGGGRAAGSGVRPSGGAAGGLGGSAGGAGCDAGGMGGGTILGAGGGSNYALVNTIISGGGLLGANGSPGGLYGGGGGGGLGTQSGGAGAKGMILVQW